MNLEKYINDLFDEYLKEKMNLKKYDSVFEEFTDFILKVNDEYLSVGNKIDLKTLNTNEINLFTIKYNNSISLDEETKKFFDQYLLKIISTKSEYNKYYFKIEEGDINPENIVDSNSIILICKIRINYDLDFKLFLKKQNLLKIKCAEIENVIMKNNNIKIKILFDMID